MRVQIQLSAVKEREASERRENDTVSLSSSLSPSKWGKRVIILLCMRQEFAWVNKYTQTQEEKEEKTIQWPTRWLETSIQSSSSSNRKCLTIKCLDHGKHNHNDWVSKSSQVKCLAWPFYYYQCVPCATGKQALRVGTERLAFTWVSKSPCYFFTSAIFVYCFLPISINFDTSWAE